MPHLYFFSICKLLLDKKRKKKKRKLLSFAKVFSLANEVFFDFSESFLRKIRPKNYYSGKFQDFLISRKFSLIKISTPKVGILENGSLEQPFMGTHGKNYLKTFPIKNPHFEFV